MTLHDLDGSNRTIAIKLVDALDDLVGLVLQVEAASGLSPDNQGAAQFLRIFARTPRPLDSLWFAMPGQRFAHNFRPARHELPIGKAIARKAGLGQFLKMLVEPFHVASI